MLRCAQVRFAPPGSGTPSWRCSTARSSSAPIRTAISTSTFPNATFWFAGGPVSAERWPILDIRNGGWIGGLVRAHETLATLVKPDRRIVPANGGMLRGADIARHRDVYQKIFKTLFVFLNKGFVPTDVVAAQPLKDHEAEFGDPAAFLDGACRSVFLAYVPD
jgi:hypothetical protein